MLAGVLLVPCVYDIVLRISESRFSARVGALLVATNPFLIWYSQEIRSYSLALLFVGAGLAGVVRWVTGGSRRSALAGGILLGLAVGTHYFTGFLVGATIAWLLVAHRRRGLGLVVAPVAVIGGLLTPFVLSQRSYGLQDWIADWPVRFRLSELGRHLVVGPSEPTPWLWLVAWGAVVAIVAAGLARGIPPAARSVLAGLGFLALVEVGVPLLLSGVGLDYFLDRNLIFVLVPVLAIVAVLAGRIRWRWALAVPLVTVLVAVGAGSSVFVDTTTAAQRADWRGLAALVGQRGGPRAVVFDVGDVQAGALTHYLHRARPVAERRRIRVREVVVVGVRPTSHRCSFWFGRACSLVFLDARPTPAATARFPSSTRERSGEFVIARLRAPHLVTVRAGDLVPAPGPGSLVIVQRPPHAVRRGG